MEKHSDKAVKTLALMGTVGTDWKQADIRWVEELRWVPGFKRCPVCDGNSKVWTKPGEYAPVAKPPEMESFYWLNRMGDAKDMLEGCDRVNCKNCETVRDRGNWRGHRSSSGRVPALVQRMVMVGYPIWPEGCRFDSRFSTGRTDRHCCELCSKTLQTYQVPAVGTGADGTKHGMWVGTDCAKKFLAGLHVYPPKKGAEFIMDEVE